jgi:hypothetical protein
MMRIPDITLYIFPDIFIAQMQENSLKLSVGGNQARRIRKFYLRDDWNGIELVI